jgi:anti-sigma B factor antagonist
MENGRLQLIIDLSQTTYINSGGLRILVTAWRKTQEQQGNLVLCGLNDRLLEIFAMVGFDKVFRLFPDCPAATQFLTTN